MKYVIIGSAGHVDHGKTALIKALTGTDTDRLKEEKARGISIDLGFASLALGEGITAGIVDVPGHERFLKNMLAGTGGIDLVMLVIAADEGVMPQTREHLAMLELYGVKNGVIVINKVDKVEADWLDMVEEDIGALLEGTFLAAAPRCRVSALTGVGLAELRQTLAAAAAGVAARDSQAPFRLWIDRTFSVKGHGAVVTGSVLSGTAAVGDSLRLYPGGDMVRVRGLEWHGSKVDRIYAGQRAAVNIGGLDGDLGRGMALSAADRGLVSASWDILADWRVDAPAGTRVRLHLGTGEFLARVHYFKDQSPGLARLILEEPLAAGLGDRGILRLYSPQHLLGGVTLVAPGASRRVGENRRALFAALAARDWPATVASLVADFGQPVAESDIRRAAGYAKDALIDEAIAGLINTNLVVRLGDYYLAAAGLAALTERLTRVLAAYHREHPDKAGLTKETLRHKLDPRLKERPFESLLAHWQARGVVTVSGADIAAKEFASRHSDWREGLLARVDDALDGSGLTGVDWPALAEKLELPADKSKAALDTLVRQGTLVRIGDILVYRKTIQYIAKLIQKHFAANPTITVAQLRDLMGTSRKVALPLLEYYDLHKYTVRDGDIRRPGPKLRDLSE